MRWWVIALFALGSVGCAGSSEVIIVGTDASAGADGTVQIENIEGGNHLVTVVIDGLTPPRRLGQGLTTFVVWFEGEDGVRLAGVLEYDEVTRQGRMFATTPLSTFLFKITAEVDGAPDAPSDVVVVRERLSHE